MKTETLYICETCTAKYTTEEECQKCEAYHNKANTILSQNFNHNYGENAKYPGELIVEMANNHKIIYRFYKPIVEKTHTPNQTNNQENTQNGGNNG